MKKSLIEDLKVRYLNSNSNDKVVNIHVFGLERWQELSKFTLTELKEIAEAATGKNTYGTELQKMKNVGRFINYIK